MTMNFNRYPYFDDFDETRNYSKFLFRHNRAIQNRELLGIQSLFQSQIKKFGDHFFKSGSRVSGGRVADPNYHWVIVKKITPESNQLVTAGYLKEGGRLRGRVTKIDAKIMHVEPPTPGDDRWVIYLGYLNAAIDAVTTSFLGGEQIDVLDDDGNVLLDLIIPCPDCGDPEALPDGRVRGMGTLFSIEDGVFYRSGIFANVNGQKRVIGKYDIVQNGVANPFHVGIQIVESVVTAEMDPALYDGSLGYPNTSAPGADRWKYDTVLTVLPLDADLRDYITLATYGPKGREFIKADSEYSEITKFMEQRTYEESGNYWLTAPTINFIEHKAKFVGDPTGYSVYGDPAKFVAIISPLISYVQGRRTAVTTDTYLINDKARTTNKARGITQTITPMRYIEVEQVGDTSIYPGSIVGGLFTNNELAIHPGDIADGPGGSKIPSGLQIGTAKVIDFQHIGGLKYRLFLADIKMNDGKKLVDAKSICNLTTKFIARLDKATVQESDKATPIWSINRSHLKSLRNALNPERGSITLYKRKKMVGTIDSAGVVTFSASENESFSGFNSSSEVAIVEDSRIRRLNVVAGTVTTSSTKLTVKAAVADAGKTVIVITDVLCTNVKERTKTLKYVTDDIGVLSTDQKMYLSKADVVGIKKVMVYPKASKDVVASHIPVDPAIFNLDRGITDYAYTLSSIKLAGTAYPADLNEDLSNYGMFIEYSYYDHSSSSGFFDVDSYNESIAAGEIRYEDLPVYTSSSSNVSTALAFGLDFRPLIIGTDPFAMDFPTIGSLLIYDVEYFIPRKDIVQIDRDGQMEIVKGVASDTPVPPKPDRDKMKLFDIDVPAYTYNIEDVKYTTVDNRRYTMRDIGVLDKRVRAMEYYTSLTQLESDANRIAVKDDDGINRFKNGFIVDNFKDFQAADIADPEFQASLDTRRGELRPRFEMYNRKAKFLPSESSNYALKNGQLLIAYEPEMVLSQPFATKSISVNPFFMFNRKGQVTLTPNVDTWSDTVRLPNAQVTADMGASLLESIESRLPAQFGAWNVTNVTNISTKIGESSAVASSTTVTPLPPVVPGGRSEQAEVTTTNVTTRSETFQASVQTDFAREVRTPRVDTRTDTYEIGDHMTSAAIQPFMRETTFDFSAKNLAKNTRVYAFFDGIDITESTFSSNGTAGVLRTDDNGSISGTVFIPGGRFYTGQKQFKLTGSPINSTDPDMMLCSATSTFFAGGMTKTLQGATLNVIQPVVSIDESTETRTETALNGPPSVVNTVTGVDVSTSVVATPCAETETTVSNRDGRFNGQGLQSSSLGWAARVIVDCNGNIVRALYLYDPLAQSFTLEKDSYVTGIDLFFAERGEEESTVFVDLREMYNGYPVEKQLIREILISKDLNTSVDSNMPHHVDFSYPIFVKGGTQYCWVVGGSSPQVRHFAARLGQPLIDNPGKIVETQPTIETSFRSQNGSTWNAEQFEDLKYNLYTAKFNTGESTWAFEFEDDSDLLPGYSLGFTAGSNKVRVYAPDNASIVGDKMKLRLFEGYEVTLTAVTDGVLKSGSDIVSGSGSFHINAVLVDPDDPKVFRGAATMVDGYIPAGTEVTVDGKGYTLTVGFPDVIFGIPSSELNKTHNIVEVKSKMFTDIVVPTNATETGRYENIIETSYNRSYNIVNVSSDLMDHDVPFTMSMTGVASNVYNDRYLAADYSVVSNVDLTMNADVHLAHPMKFIADANTSPTRKTKVKIKTKVKDNVSPITNVDTLSATFVGNKLSMETPTTLGVDYKPETHATDGSQLFKYVTMPVVLDNPAYEVNIFLEVYCGPTNDYDVYFRSVPAHEQSIIKTKEWILVPHEKIRSSNPSAKIELELSLRDLVPSWDDGEEIAVMQVKIVGMGTNSSSPPIFSNLRIIAST